MKIDDSPPYSVILQQYRELSNVVVDAAKGAKEQQLVGLLALKGMIDGVCEYHRKSRSAKAWLSFHGIL